MTALTRRLALVSPIALAACSPGAKPDTTAVITRVINAIGGDGKGLIGAVAILARARPDLVPPATAAQVVAGLLGAKGALTALRDGPPGAVDAKDVWGNVDAALGIVDGVLAALPIGDANARRYIADAQLAVLLVRTVMLEARG